jgi:flagellar biosynthetic protein FlhB
MAENDSQERSEEATPKRLEDARKKGQVARSRELVTLGLIATAIAATAAFGGSMIDALKNIMRASFAPPSVPQGEKMVQFLGAQLYEGLIAILPMLFATGLVAGLTTLSVGGWIFSAEAVRFDPSRLDPIKGLGRMFSLSSLMELLKASMKFVFVGGIAAGWLWVNSEAFVKLNRSTIDQALSDYLGLLLSIGLAILAPLFLIASIDTPYQIWNHGKQLRMTRKELKDDMKETEGDPYLRAQMRRRQQEAAQERRMLGDVPEAAVVITNPSHFAVALKYDKGATGAPVVIAKGADVLALEIRKVAASHKIATIEAPPLARALFHSVPLGEPIPEALYLAVAKVLAYVHDLRRMGARTLRPRKLRGLAVPSGMEPDSA